VLDESLGCVAAQQLLSRHISGSSPFTLTQNYLSNLGYPEKTRNIALINGSNIGTNLSFSLGDQIFNNQWYWTALLGYCHELTINTTKVNKTDQEVSIIRIISGFNPLSLLTGVPIPIIEWHTGKYTSDDKAYDNCPAGIIDLSDYNLDIDEFSFVPTASSIDLSDDIFNSAGGLHYFNSSTNTKDNLINNNLTPFDDIYSQNLNTGHTYVIAISTLINTLIEQEIMHEDMYIQNRIIDQDIDFEAANEIHIGNDVNPFNNKNINVGDVVFKSGSNSLLSAPSIVLKPGTKIEEGSDFRAFSDNTSKLNSEKKTITKQTPQIYGSKIVDNDSKYYVKNISKGIESISWTLFSENNNYKSGESEFIVPENIPGGQYTLEVEIEDNTSIISSSTKVLWINNPTSTEKAKIESPDITQSVNIKVFPNPTSKNLNVEVENSEELFFVQIFDLNGQVLYKNSFTGKGIIDLSDLKGYFLIKIVQNNETITRKILSL
jgi:hypothetical protein